MAIEIIEHRVDGWPGGPWRADRAGRFADAIARGIGRIDAPGDWQADIYVDISGQWGSPSEYCNVAIFCHDDGRELMYKVRISDHDLPLKYHALDASAAMIIEVRTGDGTRPAQVAKSICQAIAAAVTAPA